MSPGVAKVEVKGCRQEYQNNTHPRSLIPGSTMMLLPPRLIWMRTSFSFIFRHDGCWADLTIQAGHFSKVMKTIVLQETAIDWRIFSARVVLLDYGLPKYHPKTCFGTSTHTNININNLSHWQGDSVGLVIST